MKKFLAKVLAGLFLPVAFAAVTINTSEKPVSANPKTFPYIIEIVEPDGSAEAELTGQSSAGSALEIAKELGAHPDQKDIFKAFPDIPLQMGSKITMYRTPEFTIIDAKKATSVRSWQKTVGDLLDEQGVELGEDDKINYAPSAATVSGMKVQIIRVAVTQVKEKEQIDYKIVKKEDKTLDQGKMRIEQKGQKGEKLLTYEVRREDGVQVSKKLLTTEITTPSVDEIQIIGTKPVITGWCKYNDWVLDASIKNNLDPNKLCALMKKESWGHPDSSGQGGAHLGLFQYDPGFWESASAKAGYTGADIFDPKAQIYVTAWALTHGYSGRW